MADKEINPLVSLYAGPNASDWNIPALANAIKLKFGVDIQQSEIEQSREIGRLILEKVVSFYEEKERALGQELMRHMERIVFLQVIDSKWKDHLYAMDNMREGIGLRAYGQRDPLIEYKREAFEMFSQMVSSIEEEALEMLFKLQPVRPERFRGVFSGVSQQMVHPEISGLQAPPEETVVPQNPMFGPGQVASRPAAVPTQPKVKVGRNDPCPCGSGKKYKKCCGR
jgi:preprotein translocase subunit SecA